MFHVFNAIGIALVFIERYGGGIIVDVGGKWLRETCLILARETHTSLSDFLDMPLCQLSAWAETCLALLQKRKR